MNRMPWFKFYPADWIKGTRELSAEEKAVWIDLLAYMWESPERGKIVSTWEGIARMTGVEWNNCSIIIHSLGRKKVLSVTDRDREVTLISRRMLHEHNSRESTRLRNLEYRRRKRDAIVTDKTQKSDSEDIKDKDIKTRDFSLSKTSFQKPTLEDITAYCKDRSNNISPIGFFEYYESTGWVRGKTKIKDWKACIRTWEARNNSAANSKEVDFKIELEKRRKLDELSKSIINN